MIDKTWGSAGLDESTALEDTAKNGLLTLLSLLERNCLWLPPYRSWYDRL